MREQWCFTFTRTRSVPVLFGPQSLQPQRVWHLRSGITLPVFLKWVTWAMSIAQFFLGVFFSRHQAGFSFLWVSELWMIRSAWWRFCESFGPFLGEYQEVRRRHFTSFYWKVICCRRSKVRPEWRSRLFKIINYSYPLLTVVTGDLWIICGAFYIGFKMNSLLNGQLGLFLLLFLGSAGGQEVGQECLANFKSGREDFVLDADDSVKDGATFISSPKLNRYKDCLISCCKEPRCNVAFMEKAGEEGLVKSCFLFDCLYKKKYVCHFVRRTGYINYIMDSVYEDYLALDAPTGKPKTPANII